MSRAIRAQQRSLDPLAQIILHNRVALDYLLAAQGGVCAEANTSCCTWLNHSFQVVKKQPIILNPQNLLRDIPLMPRISLGCLGLKFFWYFQLAPKWARGHFKVRSGLQIVLLVVVLICLIPRYKAADVIYSWDGPSLVKFLIF